MPNQPKHAWSGIELDPKGQLRKAAVSAFPEVAQLASANLAGSRLEVWSLLCSLAGVTSNEFAQAIAKVLNLEACEQLEPKQNAVNMLPSSLAESELLLPLEYTGNVLKIATAYPFLGAGIRRAKFAAGHQIALCIAPPEVIEVALLSAYSIETERYSAKLSNIQLGSQKSSSAVDKLAHDLLSMSIDKRASDLHIKPFIRGREIRIRVDGVLIRLSLMPDSVGDHLIRYFKAHGGMEPTISHIPQDGRMSLVHKGRQFDLRISILPATGGENMVIRFLEQGRVYNLSQTGLSLMALQTTRRMLSNASGLILMTGPTGSGKSTTLYSMLSEINHIGINVMTIENPVEYRLSGITQVEVREKAGLTFPSVIRSCLRQDPDVILVGEIRDEETARVAMQAAITGHLVLSTLHTNDAVTTVSRLIGLGIPNNVLADALIGVIAQRLVRKLCSHCKVKAPADDYTDAEALYHEMTRLAPGYRPGGCQHCDNTGYHGRLPIVEVLENNRTISQLIGAENTSAEMLRQANESELKSLSDSVSRLIVSGETSLDETLRIVGRSFWVNLAERYNASLPPSTPVLKIKQESRNAVLTISSDESLTSALGNTCKEHAMTHYHVENSEQASELLRAHHEIFFVLMDLADIPDADNISLVAQAREHLYWSHLPAILLLPEGHAELASKLQSEGAISEMLTKPVSAEEIYRRIRAFIFAS